MTAAGPLASDSGQCCIDGQCRRLAGGAGNPVGLGPPEVPISGVPAEIVTYVFKAGVRRSFDDHDCSGTASQVTSMTLASIQ